MQPGPELLHFMLHRLKNFDYTEFQSAQQRFRYTMDQLNSQGIFMPGVESRDRGYWMFPFVVENKALFLNYMLLRGVCVYHGTLKYVKPAEGYADAEHAKWFMSNVLYLPVHSGVSSEYLREMIQRVIESHNSLTKTLRSKDMPQPTQPLTQKYLMRAKL